MKWISYGWTVLINLITLGVVFAIFDAVYGSFETIVCSLLILIYVTLVSFSSIYGQTVTKKMFMDYERYKKLRDLVQQHPDPNEAAETEDEETAREAAKKSEAKFYINAIFSFLIYITAVLNIFSAL